MDRHSVGWVSAQQVWKIRVKLVSRKRIIGAYVQINHAIFIDRRGTEVGESRPTPTSTETR